MVKRALFITHRERVIGGGEISLFELIKNLDPRRVMPFLIMAGGQDMRRLAEDSGVTPVEMELPPLKPGNILPILGALLRLVAFTIRNKIDILHANTSRAMAYAGVAAKLSGRRTVWHVRVGEKDPPLDSALYYLADAVVCNSRATARRFDGFKKPEKIKVVYNGLDPSKYFQADKRTVFSHIPEDHRIVLNIGRIDPWKRQDLFLRMAKAIHDRHPGVIFVLVGEDKSPGKEYFYELQKMTEELSLGKNVLFMGERDDIPEILSECDLLVLTSKEEPFGRVVIEAMASRKPVVSFEGGGVGEIIDDGRTGFLIREGDLPAMAEKVWMLLSGEQRREEMGACGQEKVLAQFTSALHAKKIEDLYEGMP